MQREIILEKYSCIDGKSIYFEKYRGDELIKTIEIYTFIKEHNDFKYIVMLNTSGKTIFEAYEYLNENMAYDSWKKREKSMQALKLLFCFVELFNITDYKKLTRQEFNMFNTFLSGGIQKGNFINFNCKTVRQSETLNQYMSVYRSFYSYLGINYSIFHETKNSTPIFKTSATSSGYMTTTQKFKSNKSQPNIKRLPKYIRVNEYRKILSLLEQEDNNYGLREKIIIKLMFEYGLRISEVLGLTLEDIKPANNGHGKIILRNRISDKQYHHCKNLIVPKNPNEYNYEEYNKEKVGFHTVIVKEEIIGLIKEYLRGSRDIWSMTDVAIKNIEQAKADKVEKSSVGDNYYIFLNKNYTPLSKSGWNQIIRKIYESVGIEVDKGVKRNNLSHRFRHGYAMMCIQMGVDKYALRELLRHRYLQTLEIYFNPTVEDNIEVAIKVSKLIDDKISIDIDQQLRDMK